MIDFVILALATWRIASLVAEEEGLFGWLEWVRNRIGVRYDEHSYAYGENELADRMLCIWCSTPWIGAALTVLYLLAPTITRWAATPLALSAVAIAVNARGIRYRKGRL
jgi:hypothetical protein